MKDYIAINGTSAGGTFIPTKIAKAIDGILIDREYHSEYNGDYILMINCSNYEEWSKFPAVVEYEGRKYGNAGWNGELETGYYSTGKKFATY